MTGIYRWKINGTTVNPVFGKDVTKDIEQENGQMFFREKLNGKLTFKGVDYIWLNSQPFDTNFITVCDRYINNAWQLNYYTGIFNKTDCTWDTDNLLVETAINVYDNYTKILAGQDVQYDLIKPTDIINIDGSITTVSLSPALTSLNLDKRPLIQVYSPGDEVVSCFIGGIYWEQPVLL